MTQKHAKIKTENSKHFCCVGPNVNAKIGWLSLQGDGSVSFGLSDKTFISPKKKFSSGIWNAYNRIGIDFLIESNPLLLEGVRNPHFTYHPVLKFHLKDQHSERGRATTIFEGIADVGIVLEQQGELPLIRTISNPISSLKEHKLRSGNEQVEIFEIKAPDKPSSIKIEIDILKFDAAISTKETTVWLVKWGLICLRCRMSPSPPQVSTLSWYYEY